MKKALLLLAFALPAGHAQTVSTDPVGFIPVTAAGNSDTFISTPLHRGAAFRGVLASVNGAELTVSGATFSADQFNDTHFVLIASGPKEGMWYGITDTDGAKVTVDLAGDTLGSAVVSQTEVQIIPFWTLNTLFPNGAGVKPSPTLLPQTRILIPDQTRAGIELAPTLSFFYYSGTQFGTPGATQGWRKFGANPNQKFDNFPLLPDSYFIVRHEVAGETTITIPGAVQMTSLATVVGTLAANKAQDNAIAFNVAVPTTLAASGLFPGAIAGTSIYDPFQGVNADDVAVDQLLVFNNATAQKNKQPSARYYYYLGDGGSLLAGWRLAGSPATVRNEELIFQPAFGYVIRKSATQIPVSSFSSVRPAYVP